MSFPAKKFNRRRLFIAEPKKNPFQIFSFEQHKDGSIYFSWPNFDFTKWLNFENNDSGIKLAALDTVGDGKLSVHASGMSTYRAHADPKDHKLIIHGNYLLDLEKQAAGARHLFTAFMMQPIHVPLSPAFNRESDYVINALELKPSVTLFFAIPQMKNPMKINVGTSFHMNDLDSIPPVLGAGLFDLRYHDVFWMTYQTKHMDDWPKKNYIFYGDGFHVPVFIGVDKGALRVDLKKPEYQIEDNKLTIQI